MDLTGCLMLSVEVAKALSESVHITETVLKAGMRVMQKQEKSRETHRVCEAVLKSLLASKHLLL